MKNILKASIFFLSIIVNMFDINCVDNQINLPFKNRIIHDFEIKRSFDKENVIPIAILGAGPAGLTAAMYGIRAGIYTAVFTGDLPGGQLTQTSYVENWPGIKKALGYEIMDNLLDQAKEFGAKIIQDSIVEVDFKSWPFVLKTANGEKINALSVIIATGAAPRRLGIPGEIEYWGRGVSSCAVCDCHFFKNKDVVVIGGGDAAVEEAMLLAPYAKNITILVRSDRMRAATKMRDKLDEFENIKVVYNKKINKILGDGESLTGVELEDSGSGEISKMPVDGVFLAIGQNPNTDLFGSQLELNKFGYIILEGRSQSTSIQGVFAAGDVEDAEYRQAVVAASSGCKAALESVKWLREIGFTEKTARNLSAHYYN